MTAALLQPNYRPATVPLEDRTPHAFGMAQHIRDVHDVSNARQHELQTARALGLQHATPKLAALSQKGITLLRKEAEMPGTTWQPSGVTNVGAWDAEKYRADPAQAMHSNIERGFRVNETVDAGSEMSEPGMIPNQYKIAGARQALEDLGLSKLALSSRSAPGFKIPSPKAPSMVGKAPVKPPPLDPMANLTALNTNTNVGTSFQSASRRAMGNPTS